MSIIVEIELNIVKVNFSQHSQHSNNKVETTSSSSIRK